MTARTHRYAVELAWTGARGIGTRAYDSYGRDHVLSTLGKPDIAGSAGRAFQGDADRWDPEELLVGALAACHQLAYLHLCAEAGVTVVAYADAAAGAMQTDGAGGRFTEVVLNPRVRLAPGADVGKALELHAEAARRCFIASSVNFPVRHAPHVEIAEPG